MKKCIRESRDEKENNKKQKIIGLVKKLSEKHLKIFSLLEILKEKTEFLPKDERNSHKLSLRVKKTFTKNSSKIYISYFLKQFKN